MFCIGGGGDGGGGGEVQGMKDIWGGQIFNLYSPDTRSRSSHMEEVVQ